jgi:hypothetical protein
MSVVVYGCHKPALTAWEENESHVFNHSSHKNIRTKDEGASWKSVILHNEELCDLYRSPDDVSIGYDGMNMQLGEWR